jgi:hypothetical protein
MSDTEKVNKTKLLLALKTEITDVKQALDVEKSQVEKLHKRLAQVGPALDDIHNTHKIFLGGELSLISRTYERGLQWRTRTSP